MEKSKSRVELSKEIRTSPTLQPSDYGNNEAPINYQLIVVSLLPFAVYFLARGDLPCNCDTILDKKLESAREDFVFQAESNDESHADQGVCVPEDDSVLTSGEVSDLIQLKEVDFDALKESPIDRTEIDGPLDFRIIRNSDFRELILEVEGKTVLNFAICYGFQNLQNIARKVKTRKSDYQFVEVMACTSGFLNGGGQIKPKPGQSPKELIKSLEAIYMENVLEVDPFKNPLVKRLYDEWLGHAGSLLCHVWCRQMGRYLILMIQ
ncbi:hypothetical protein J1N35_032621 [Gossypium stocksii]|uniref:Iron hydrogenase large subunit C-terminal domain-containing protein n=1 Tax=Gossypium stocksii TaxID=47602 RepID=A0A9D3V4V0_9ROSI|nr:hypothetical protein J1N35_032621 [Gossypium stocksii]